MKNQSLDTRLSGILETLPSLRLAFIFGSFANGSPGPDSDVDVAVLYEHPLDAQQKMALIQAIAEATDRPVDLVDLHRAGEPLLGQILKGRRIFGSDSEHAELGLRHIYQNEDFMPYVERMLRERRQAWIG
ncbi:type VII toxin-antitoxin system MntA family adenylyltransferase antitoxin [Thauera sp.]|uniref:type VII toxin-antitoxin system MntA family adenylyltransferase antitoxin n=1 Tax=Thauera sp. TaxID=1905334 RepID=UPI0039E574B3